MASPSDIAYNLRETSEAIALVADFAHDERGPAQHMTLTQAGAVLSILARALTEQLDALDACLTEMLAR